MCAPSCTAALYNSAESLVKLVVTPSAGKAHPLHMRFIHKLFTQSANAYAAMQVVLKKHFQGAAPSMPMYLWCHVLHGPHR